MAETFSNSAQDHQVKIEEPTSAENPIKTEQPNAKRARLMEKDDDDKIKKSSQLARKENDMSSKKSSIKRNIDDCLNELMAISEQHTQAKIDLKTEYNAKVKQMQRDYDRRVEDVKKKCFSEAGF